MQLGWIDFSREERNKIVSLIRLLGTSTAMDELGIGTVRDSFSDALFPGISTLQTRAKYFVLVPYLFQEAVNHPCRSRREVLAYIHRCEDLLVETLVRTSGDTEDGIIGSRTFKQGRTVKMKPSGIYWSGLHATGILRYPQLSMDDVCSRIAQEIQRKKITDLKTPKEEDDGSDDSDALRSQFTLFSPLVPDYDFLHDATIQLTRKEADYLREHFLTAEGTKNSLMAWLLRQGKSPDSLRELDADAMPKDLGRTLVLSRQFADFIYGAHLLYNLLYAEGCGCRNETVEGIQAEFDDYAAHYQRPEMEAILDATRHSEATAVFFRSFDSAIADGAIEKAKELIVRREKLVKGNRAKLGHPDTYRFERPVHHYRLDYRYGTARVILTDILSSLEGAHGTQTI